MHWCPCILLNKRRHEDNEVGKGTLTARGGGEDSHIKRMGCWLYLSGVKKEVLVALKVFSLKRLTAGALAAPFRVLSLKQ